MNWITILIVIILVAALAVSIFLLIRKKKTATDDSANYNALQTGAEMAYDITAKAGPYAQYFAGVTSSQLQPSSKDCRKIIKARCKQVSGGASKCRKYCYSAFGCTY